MMTKESEPVTHAFALNWGFSQCGMVEDQDSVTLDPRRVTCPICLCEPTAAAEVSS